MQLIDNIDKVSSVRGDIVLHRIMNFFKNLFNFKSKNQRAIIIVSGLPRSGTSMMMQILEAGGIQPITDNKRTADQNNSKGYYEHDGVKALERGQHECLEDAEGRAIKVVSNLLRYLPADRHYKVIFMRRDLDEMLASQAAMPNDLQSNDKSSAQHQRLKDSFSKHLERIEKWLEYRSNMDVLTVNYADVLAEPKQEIGRITELLNIRDAMPAMVASVDRNMRNQGSHQ